MMVCDLLAMNSYLISYSATSTLLRFIVNIAEIYSQYQVTMAGPSQRGDSHVIQVLYTIGTLYACCKVRLCVESL